MHPEITGLRLSAGRLQLMQERSLRLLTRSVWSLASTNWVPGSQGKHGSGDQVQWPCPEEPRRHRWRHNLVNMRRSRRSRRIVSLPMPQTPHHLHAPRCWLDSSIKESIDAFHYDSHCRFGPLRWDNGYLLNCPAIQQCHCLPLELCHGTVVATTLIA